MTHALDPGRFEPPLTFMGVPYGHDLAAARAVVVGLPFDVGTDRFRVGARHGPQAIRIQSGRIGRYAAPELDVDVPQALGLVDCGDVRLLPSELEQAHAAIEAALAPIAAAGVVPYTMGGDGTVTLGQIRALARAHPGLVVLHLDAHTDAGAGESRAAATGTTFRHAAQERLVDVTASMHVGVRGPHKGPGVYRLVDALGYRTVRFAELRERGLADLLAEIHQRMAGRPVYLCFDMDFFDPAFAPGVCAPTPGGASSEEGLALVDGLAGLDLVAVDVNTVSPPHDPAGTTALLAARVLFGFLALQARRVVGGNEA